MADRARSFRVDPASPRLAFGLIVCLVLLAVVAAVVPQQGADESVWRMWRDGLGSRYAPFGALGLDRITTAPTLFAVVALLVLNLAANNLRRLRRLAGVRGGRARLRLAGSVVFHLALLLLLGAMVLNYLFAFRGVLALTEGQTVSDAPPEYHRLLPGPLNDRAFGRFDLVLDSIRTDYPVGEAETEAALVRVAAAAGAAVTGEILINRPLAAADLEFHLGRVIGYSPEAVVTDADGDPVFRGFVRLAARPGSGGVRHADLLPLPGGRDTLRLEVVPSVAGGAPGRLVSLVRGDSLLASGALGPADTLSAGGLSVSVPRVRRWCYLSVVADPFLDLVFAGFWIGLAGLSITLLARLRAGRKEAS